MAVAVTIAFGAGAATAHSFKVAVIAPLSGPTAEIGKQTLDGFMLATRQADSHPGQESDGHLGGLDVYVSVVDGESGPAVSLGGMEELVEGNQIVVVAEFARAKVTRAIQSRAAGPQAIFIALSAGPSPIAGAYSIPDMDEPARISFVVAFEEDYGHAPSRHAVQGYGAARLIDRAIRAVGGNMSAVRDLRAAFAAASSP